LLKNKLKGGNMTKAPSKLVTKDSQKIPHKKTMSVELKKKIKRNFKPAPKIPVSFSDLKDALSVIFEYLDDKSKINFTKIEKYCNETFREQTIPIIQKYRLLLNQDSTVAEKVQILQDTENAPLTGEDIRNVIAPINTRQVTARSTRTPHQNFIASVAPRTDQERDDFMILDAITEHRMPELVSTSNQRDAIQRANQQPNRTSEHNPAELILGCLIRRGADQEDTARRIIENPEILIRSEVISSIGNSRAFLNSPKVMTAFLNSRRVDENRLYTIRQIRPYNERNIFVNLANRLLEDYDFIQQNPNDIDSDDNGHNPQDIAALREARDDLLLRRRNANNEN
jgi:hypothetical protein